MQCSYGVDRALFYGLTNNLVIHKGKDLLVMLVKGRDDESYHRHLGKDGMASVLLFHVNPTEECFYQIRESINLKVIHEIGPTLGFRASIRDVVIPEGGIYVLPPNIPHYPSRPVESMGIVVESSRRGQLDSLQWRCSSCLRLLHSEQRYIHDDLKGEWDAFITEAKRLQIVCLSCKNET